MSTPHTISKDTAQKNSLSTDRQSQPFEKAVVVHVITDPESSRAFASLYPTLYENYNPDNGKLPKNACFVRTISQGADTIAASPVLAYPFFSSHLSMPVKVGETVWVMFDREIKNFGYWVTRVHGDEYTEDLNYSHYDRTYQTPKKSTKDSPGTAEKFEGKKEAKDPGDDFPNLSLTQKTNRNEFDVIVSGSFSPIRNEPVPRFMKRPGDFAIHGSNNSMIVFGSDRFWKRDDDLTKSQSSATQQPREFSGCVDIVAGRSRGIVSGSMTRTVPETFQNSRKYFEVAKNARQQKKKVIIEGDPDFHTDAARLYISMHTQIDESLSLKDYIPNVPTEAIDTRPLSLGSSAILKADHIRLVSRKDQEIGINGTIRIIKEGLLSGDGADGCSINLLEDGVIHIASQKLYLGLSVENGGDTDANGDEVKGERQPYIRYKELKELLDKVFDDISSFCNTLMTHVTPGYGAPSPQILSAAQALMQNVASRKGEIKNIKSSRIFGE